MHVIRSVDMHPCNASHAAAALAVLHHVESLQMHHTSLGTLSSSGRVHGYVTPCLDRALRP